MDRVTALLPKPPTIKELSTVLQYVNCNTGFHAGCGRRIIVASMPNPDDINQTRVVGSKVGFAIPIRPCALGVVAGELCRCGPLYAASDTRSEVGAPA